MENSRLTFLDRLQKRGYIDQWGFAFFAGAGSIGIVAAKISNAPPTWVALGAIAVMFLYAGLIWRYGSGRLQSDQAGDNCYYLGLIFTLASLAYAIFTFDPANTATTIIQGFGIALATTIFGLVLRVIFNQGRPDLEEVESGARHDLIDAVARLKTELSQSVVLMNDFGLHIRQSISETRDSTTKDLAQFTATSMAELKKTLQEVQSALLSESSGFTARTKRQAAVVDRLVLALEKHSDDLNRFGQVQDKISDSLNSLNDSAVLSRSAAEMLSKEVGGAVGAVQRLAQNADTVAGAIGALKESTEKVGAAVDRVQSRIDAQIEQLKAAPSEIVKEAINSLVASAAALREELTKLRVVIDCAPLKPQLLWT